MLGEGLDPVQPIWSLSVGLLWGCLSALMGVLPAIPSPDHNSASYPAYRFGTVFSSFMFERFSYSFLIAAKRSFGWIG
jgi:hypothetical protein